MYDLMVGDILDIEIGDVLLVDGILVKSSGQKYNYFSHFITIWESLTNLQT